MRSAGGHGRKRKVRRTGRHAALSPAGKAARQAGKAAPAVAILGALATAPQLHHLPPAGHRTTADRMSAAPVLSAPGKVFESAESGTYRPQRALPAIPRHTASSANTPAGRHRRGAANSGGSSSHRSAASGGTLHCSGTTGMLPANYATIVGFLTTHGYTGIAAAGIAGNIYQESMGNPESVGSGGGGLIGWTPLPAGFVTGNASADLQTQLQAILTFNQQFAADIPALNAATSPAEAADIYVTDFEHAGIPATGNREAAANAVAAACGL